MSEVLDVDGYPLSEVATEHIRDIQKNHKDIPDSIGPLLMYLTVSLDITTTEARKTKASLDRMYEIVGAMAKLLPDDD